MERGCFYAQRSGRLDSQHVVAHRKSGCIAPCSRSDIQNPTRDSRDQMEHLPVNIIEPDALVLLDQRLRLLGVAFGAAHWRRCHGAQLCRVGRPVQGCALMNAKQWVATPR